MLDVLQCSMCDARIPDHLAGSGKEIACPKCGEVIQKAKTGGRRRPAKHGNQTSMWNGVILALAGALAFGAGVWYFVFAAPAPSPAVTEEFSVFPPAETDPALAQAVADGTEVPPPPPAVETATPPRIPEATDPALAVNPLLTWANFNQIRKGMTEEEVRIILGDPTRSKTKTDVSSGLPRQVKVVQWTQVRPLAVIEVEFVNGLAEAKTTTLSAVAAAPMPPKQPTETSAKPPIPPAGPAGSSKLSRENFELIQTGMTEVEVKAILGPPNGTNTRTITTNGKTTRTMVFTWRQQNPHLTITVTFRNDKVAGKNWIQLNPLK
jgi:hypothetical protein